MNDHITLSAGEDKKLENLANTIERIKALISNEPLISKSPSNCNQVLSEAIVDHSAAVKIHSEFQTTFKVTEQIKK